MKPQAFLNGKTIMVGPRSDSVLWLKVLLGSSEVNTNDDVGVPEVNTDDGDARPTEPGAQQLHDLPLYALPAYRESGQGNRFASNWTHLKESVLNHRNMQARVPKDCLDDPDQAMKEMQNEESAQYIEQDVLTMTQDLDENEQGI